MPRAKSQDDSGIGGIVGGVSLTAYLAYCRSFGTVTGQECVGGLVGGSGFAAISHCYTFARVVGKHKTGGLVGQCTNDAVTACATFGRVDGEWDTGGLVGWNLYGVIANSYSVARVSGVFRVGGLVGANQGTVRTCYAAGPVTGESGAGGLIGSLSADSFYPDGPAENSFWDIDTSGRTASAGGTGKTTWQMRQRSTFADWDFTDVWDIAEGQTYPFLRE